MSPVKGYYSLVQYCPDRSRAESVNIGVLLFCPSERYLEAMLSSGNDRVRRLFSRGSFDPQRLNAVKKAIQFRLTLEKDSFREPNDLVRFIKTRSNEIVLTDSRPMKVLDPEEDLKNLFKELVGGRAKKQKKQPLFPEFDRELRSDRFRGRVRLDISIEVPVLGRLLEVPYAFQNGVMNLVRPQHFSKREANAMRSASQLALEGDLLHRHRSSNQEQRLIVIPKFHPELNGARRQIRKLFEEYKIRMVPFNSVKKFISEIEEQARPIGAP
jgi:hypothetical protein